MREVNIILQYYKMSSIRSEIRCFEELVRNNGSFLIEGIEFRLNEFIENAQEMNRLSGENLPDIETMNREVDQIKSTLRGSDRLTPLEVLNRLNVSMNRLNDIAVDEKNGSENLLRDYEEKERHNSIARDIMNRSIGTLTVADQIDAMYAAGERHRIFSIRTQEQSRSIKNYDDAAEMLVVVLRTNIRNIRKCIEEVTNNKVIARIGRRSPPKRSSSKRRSRKMVKRGTPKRSSSRRNSIKRSPPKRSR